MHTNAPRPSDVKLLMGWDWSKVDWHRAEFNMSDNMIPVAAGNGVVAWATINSDRFERIGAAETLDELIAIYQAFNEAEGLKLGSADEHLFDDDLTTEHRSFLRYFCERWEKIEEENRIQAQVEAEEYGFAPSKCLGPDVCKPSDKCQWDGDTCLICDEDHPLCP